MQGHKEAVRGVGPVLVTSAWGGWSPMEGRDAVPLVYLETGKGGGEIPGGYRWPCPVTLGKLVTIQNFSPLGTAR